MGSTEVAEPTSHRVARAVFLRGLGAVYVTAFASLAVQIHGLVGSGGILPIESWLESLHSRFGSQAYHLAPTLCWLSGSDAALSFLSWGGAAAGTLAAIGFLPGPTLLVCWAFYLSLTVAGQVFLGFQWDALLLETGFLSLFLAPWGTFRLRTSDSGEPPRAVIWLFWWLLFRLIFSSGVVKLSSGDPTWRDLTALQYHYMTQPLPTWSAWYMHHLPGFAQKASVVLMFALELAAPFLIFFGARMRLLAAVLLGGLQAVFIATGNFAYFNWLTLVLCLPLIDDRFWPRWFREPRAERRSPPAGDAGEASGAGESDDRDFVAGPRPFNLTAPRWPGLLRAVRWAGWAGAAILLVVTTVEMTDRIRLGPRWPEPFERLAELTSPIHIANAYGLFAVMTTRRPEIIIEGSADGVNWLAYGFKWKPGSLDRRPGFVAPHQPRLDWQMWFAALGDRRRAPWVEPFMRRLLEGSPEVLALLAETPFPNSPPLQIRAVTWDYDFTTPGERSQSGSWWKRSKPRLFAPVISRAGD